MTGKKIKGIYARGNTFWLTHGSGKRRLQISLETSDYAEAVAKAPEILNQPLLNPTEGFKPELDDFADEQVKAGKWTEKSRKSKYSVLLMFGEDIDWAPLPAITTATCQKWYDLQTKRIAIVTANSYVMNLKSFLNWLGDTETTTANHYAHLMPTDPDIEKLNGGGTAKKTAIPKK